MSSSSEGINRLKWDLPVFRLVWNSIWPSSMNQITTFLQKWSVFTIFLHWHHSTRGAVKGTSKEASKVRGICLEFAVFQRASSYSTCAPEGSASLFILAQSLKRICLAHGGVLLVRNKLFCQTWRENVISIGLYPFFNISLAPLRKKKSHILQASWPGVHCVLEYSEQAW